MSNRNINWVKSSFQGSSTAQINYSWKASNTSAGKIKSTQKCGILPIISLQSTFDSTTTSTMLDLLNDPRPRKHGERGVIGGLMALSFIGSLRFKKSKSQWWLELSMKKRGFSQLMMHQTNQQVWVWVLDGDYIKHWYVYDDWFQIERFEPVALHGEEVWLDSDWLHQLPELLDRTYECKGHKRIAFYLKKGAN